MHVKQNLHVTKKEKITSSAFLLLDQKFLNHIKQTACGEIYFDQLTPSQKALYR